MTGTSGHQRATGTESGDGSLTVNAGLWWEIVGTLHSHTHAPLASVRHRRQCVILEGRTDDKP